MRNRLTYGGCACKRTWSRGFALLVVLLALIVVLPILVHAAQTVSLAALDHQVNEDRQVADQIMHECSKPIVRWLQEHSESVVLPIESTEPAVAILNDRLEFHNQDLQISITAWDQHGMVPVADASTSSMIAQILPHDIRRRVRDVVAAQTDFKSIGLDTFTFHPQSEVEDWRSHAFVIGSFPRPGTQAPQQGFRVPGVHHNTLNVDSRHRFQNGTPETRHDRIALGAQVATHNGAPTRININTCSLNLLQAALRSANRGGIEAIVQARSRGRPADISVDRRSENLRIDRVNTSSVRLVASSRCWAFRIDVRVNRVHRSWWSVFEKSTSGWKCVQRLVVPD